MIQTKTYITREISRLEKRKKEIKIELLTLSKVGAIKDVFKNTSELLQKEINEISGGITSLMWVAYTNEKTLPRIKTKKKEEKK